MPWAAAAGAGVVKSELGSDVSDAEMEGARALRLGSTTSTELLQVRD